MPLSVRVWDFMDRDFATIGPEATLGEAMEAMSEAARKGAKNRSLVVVDNNNHPLGVLSMRNILDAFKPEFRVWSTLLGEEGWGEALNKGLKQCNYRLVQDYMVQVPSLKMSDDLIRAFKLLTEKKIGGSASAGGGSGKGGRCGPDSGPVRNFCGGVPQNQLTGAPHHY